MLEQPGSQEEYFSSISSLSRKAMQDVVEIRNSAGREWDNLDLKRRERLIDERLINSSVTAVPKAQKYHTLDARRRKSGLQRPPAAPRVRLSTFGVEQVYPRLKINTGQKEVVVEETSGSNSDGFCQTYTYRDEHSAPFSWLTKSQQELRFEAGTPPPRTQEDDYAAGLDALTSPSRRQQQTHLIRQSKGNPSYAKPVQIPQVPSSSPSPQQQQGGEERGRRRRMDVSPHRINNFVCETSPNRLVLDFGDGSPSSSSGGGGGGAVEKLSRGSSTTDDGHSLSDCSSARSSTRGLLARMKQRTKSSIKRSISSVSRSRKKIPAAADASESDNHLTLSTLSITRSSMTSLQSNGTLPSDRRRLLASSASLKNISKPTYAPPPPPPVKPSCAPPPPPPPARRESDGVQNSSGLANCNDRDEAASPSLEEFKVDLKVDSDIPKTGFDFLDNW